MKDKDQIAQEQQPAEASTPQTAQGRVVDSEGMSSSYSGMGNLTEGDGERMSGEDVETPETPAP